MSTYEKKGNIKIDSVFCDFAIAFFSFKFVFLLFTGITHIAIIVYPKATI